MAVVMTRLATKIRMTFSHHGDRRHQLATVSACAAPVTAGASVDGDGAGEPGT
jgi:hypothetical protein